MQTTCVDTKSTNGAKSDFNNVGEKSIQWCTNPCPLFVTLLTMEGCSISNSRSYIPGVRPLDLFVSYFVFFCF